MAKYKTCIKCRKFVGYNYQKDICKSCIQFQEGKPKCKKCGAELPMYHWKVCKGCSTSPQERKAYIAEKYKKKAHKVYLSFRDIIKLYNFEIDILEAKNSKILLVDNNVIIGFKKRV